MPPKAMPYEGPNIMSGEQFGAVVREMARAENYLKPLCYIDHPLLPEGAPVDYPHLIDRSQWSELTTIFDNLRGPDGIATVLWRHDNSEAVLQEFFDIAHDAGFELEYTVYPSDIEEHLCFTVRRCGRHVMAAFFEATEDNYDEESVDVFYDEELRKVLWVYWGILDDGQWYIVAADNGSGETMPIITDRVVDSASRLLASKLCKKILIYSGQEEVDLVVVRRHPRPPPDRFSQPVCFNTCYLGD